MGNDPAEDRDHDGRGWIGWLSWMGDLVVQFIATVVVDGIGSIIGAVLGFIIG